MPLKRGSKRAKVWISKRCEAEAMVAGGTVMIQGTTSDAGKSTLVAALCRAFVRRGLSVAPFKPQNMALNSAVTVTGGEIGRAQALQAQACNLQPHTDMNPVLLKPSSDTDAQVIIHGTAVSNFNARGYHNYKQTAMRAVLDSYQRLNCAYDIVVVEGAGSPAEINLRDKDIANMGFAEAVDCPVVLIADIDRGGVFAHLVGTLELLSATERERVIGFVINRFRGDMELLQPGIDWLETYTGKPVLGVLPYLHGLFLDAEDGIDTSQTLDQHGPVLKVVVPVFSRISNHTDFDVLRLHPQVDLQFIAKGQTIPPADLIILPGSKSVRQDLCWLHDNGWPGAIKRHLRYGGKVVGICGGYQMLGDRIADPDGIEGPPGSSAGLGLLAISTDLKPHKQLRTTTARLQLGQAYASHSGTGTSITQGQAPQNQQNQGQALQQNQGQALQNRGAFVSGYEIHCGITQGQAQQNPLLVLADGQPEGAISPDNQIIGSYLHGLFDEPEACGALLRWAGLDTPAVVDHRRQREGDINRLADCVEKHLLLDALLGGKVARCRENIGSSL